MYKEIRAGGKKLNKIKLKNKVNEWGKKKIHFSLVFSELNLFLRVPLYKPDV